MQVKPQKPCTTEATLCEHVLLKKAGRPCQHGKTGARVCLESQECRGWLEAAGRGDQSTALQVFPATPLLVICVTFEEVGIARMEYLQLR